ncbi:MULTISPECIES: RNA methyltransferase [unclassified Iodidimonas]|nr:MULTISPECIES: RNA methyltransferase [unclassified Iodidimonas]
MVAARGLGMDMRGYFAIGIERPSKVGNIGNLIRTAHGFGAAYVFSILARLEPGEHAHQSHADTARSARSVPYFEYTALDQLALPKGCQLVGVEITDEAIDLPSFHHPLNAAYIMGGERMSLSAETCARCDHLIRIPTRFSLNVATAGAIVMYDRLLARGRYAPRPLRAGGPVEPEPPHVHGGPRLRKPLKP